MGIYDSYYSEFPASIQGIGDEEWIELGAIMDGIDQKLLSKILGMKWFWDEDKSSVEMLPFLSYAVRANVEVGEAENVKRKKIWGAVARHRVKGQEASIFNLIEEVTGIAPEVISPFAVQSIWESKNNLIPMPYDFMRWDSKIGSSTGGMIWTSKTGSAMQRGEIYINIKVSEAPTSLILRVVRVIEYAGATYFRYRIGNYTAGKVWYEYRVIY